MRFNKHSFHKSPILHHVCEWACEYFMQSSLNILLIRFWAFFEKKEKNLFPEQTIRDCTAETLQVWGIMEVLGRRKTLSPFTKSKKMHTMASFIIYQPQHFPPKLPEKAPGGGLGLMGRAVCWRLVKRKFHFRSGAKGDAQRIGQRAHNQNKHVLPHSINLTINTFSGTCGFIGNTGTLGPWDYHELVYPGRWYPGNHFLHFSGTRYTLM